MQINHVIFFVNSYGLDLPKKYVRDGWLQMDPVVAQISCVSRPFELINFLKTTRKNASVRWQMALYTLFNNRRA
jgi:hypothetical protein